MDRRIPATLEAIGPSGLEHREVVGRGATTLERLFRLIMLGDFASTYLAVLLGVDPTPIPVLTRLKARLRG
jgi:glucose/mannose-6-phosphate isomerase